LGAKKRDQLLKSFVDTHSIIMRSKDPRQPADPENPGEWGLRGAAARG
jgi:hypothetical protein